jgi:hypothetical protein
LVTDLHTPQIKTNYWIYDRIEYPTATKMEKQEMAQIMERLLATINANHEKMEADRKTDKEHMLAEMKANQAKADALQAKMESNLEKMDANLKSMQERMNTGHKEMMAWLKDLKINGEETMACQENTEARLQGEPASEDMTLEVAHEQEVPVEDATRMPVGEPRKRRRDRRHLAAQRRQKKEQKRTQRKDGCRNNLVAARRAAVAWRKINVFRNILTHGYCGLRKE